MDRRAKVELFERIRREHEFGVGTIAGVAHELGAHRRMLVSQSKAHSEIAEEDRTGALEVKAAIEFMDAVLEADPKAP